MTKVTEAPNFSKREAESFALKYYGLAASAEELPSERDQNFLITAADRRMYVLKIANAAEDINILDLQNRAMRHLAGPDEPVPCPQVILSLERREIESVGDSNGVSHYLRLVSYIPGVPLAKVNPQTSDLLQDFGRFIGRLARRLETFSHPAGRRDLIWDIRTGHQTVRRCLEFMPDAGRRSLVEKFLCGFESIPAAKIDALETGVIHNDANDYNVIVSFPESGKGNFGKRHVAGIIDFGDVVHSYRLAELAVACAYVMLDKEDPLAAASCVVAGCHAVQPLRESELELLYALICLRLIMSVSICAYQTGLKPDNSYLAISERPVWRLLEKLEAVHPNLAWYTFRDACGFSPCPASNAITAWLKTHQGDFAPVAGIDLKTAKKMVFDLGLGSKLVGDMRIVDDTPSFSRFLFDEMKKSGAAIGVGRYDEARLIYTSANFRPGGHPLAEGRTVHLGIDLFLEPGSPVYSPLDAVVDSFRNNASSRDYGPTLILKHIVDGGGREFFTLYGHLSANSLEGLFVGKHILKGERIASIGAYPENGDWPPHLHFQVIADMLGMEGDFPGVAGHSRKNIWLSISPDPNPILGIPDHELEQDRCGLEEILKLRKSSLGPSLSISYQRPLKIVRGFRQYLYDETGRTFLDAVNNVPHVGHCHPRVVKAAQEQIAVLNTNTRYLHDNLVHYAERLQERLPEPLRVFFFVNSGSEANDLALRLARTYTGAKDMIVVDGAYHGHLTSLIEISPYKFDGPGGPGRPPFTQKVIMPDLYQGPYRAGDPDAGAKYAAHVSEAVERIHKEGRKPAGFICESLLSCGGQIVLPENYLREAFRRVREAGGVCVADEVQVGFGRVGTHFWGFETQCVIPDIVTMGKPIGNGHPLAAVVTTREVADAFATGMEYFNTYGGNPVSCAVGLAVLDVIEEEKLQENALVVGGRLKAGLEKLKEKHALIGDVRGLGLFVGVELVLDRKTRARATLHAAYIAERMREEGILLSTDGPFRNVLKIKPPMVFSASDADLLVAVLDKILSEDPLRV